MRRRALALWTWMFLLVALVGAPVAAAPSEQTAPVDTTFLFDTRADLELLGNLVLGEGVRPDTWTFNADINSTTFVADMWFDNEQLADVIFAVNTRPQAWLGAAGSTRDVIARNVRHDLELAADQYLGVNVRPPNWRGTTALLRCTRTLQNVLSVLSSVYGVQPQTPQSVINYCEAVRGEVEDELVEAVYTSEELALLPERFLAIRGDLERLADERLGLNNRPGAWIGNRDVASPTLVGDVFLDLETLANTLLGAGTRPNDWIGGISNTPAISFQNLRHDLELLADQTLGVNQRPFGWQGTDPLLRCVPLVQNLIYLAEQTYNFTPTGIAIDSPDYCVQIESAANTLIENPPVLDVVVSDADDRLTAESNWAFAYLDYAATQYMGIMPGGTQFRAWYRLFAGSNMMFVSGDNFALYVDHTYTTLPTSLFDSLPTIEGVSPVTFCDAAWCNGPGPTPTPTGFGALSELLDQVTPPAPGATPVVGTPQVPVTNKVQVSWNNIRVTYVQDFPDRRVAQVALEICRQPAQAATACEPVTSVTDLATGQVQPSISQYNALPVYEFRYGYSTNVLIEGATTFSNDIWISDPTIR